MANYSQNKKATSETEIRSRGIANSNAPIPGEAQASPSELALALATLERENERLREALSASDKKAQDSNSIEKLAEALVKATATYKAPTAEPTQFNDGINRTTDFKNARATIDGQNLMEAQLSLQDFKNEPRKPISISKAVANFVGANLSITINGVRVSIPCDGKTYMINESHWDAARERLAKLDILNSVTEPQITVIE